MKFTGEVKSVDRAGFFCILEDENGVFSRVTFNYEKLLRGACIELNERGLTILTPPMWKEEYEEKAKAEMKELFPEKLFEETEHGNN